MALNNIVVNPKELGFFHSTCINIQIIAIFMMSFRDKFIEILEGSISLKLYMKKLFCIILLLSIFTGVIFAQSIPKFGEAVLSSNKEKA